MNYTIPYTTAAIAGITSHLFLFISGEWGIYAANIAAVYAGLHILLLPAFIWGLGLSRPDATSLLLGLSTSYFWGLFGSIAVYRLFFHRLKAFPGPVGHKITGFWSMKNTVFSVLRFRWHRRVQKFHSRYGDFIRIRPREISINHADAIRDIHGMSTKCVKGPFYDINYPMRSLQMVRDHTYHGERRKVWNRGFTTKALNDYEPRVLKHCVDLLSQLSAQSNKVVDATRWFAYLGFDVMSELTYNESSEMLTTGIESDIFKWMSMLKPVIGALTCVPWILNLLHSLPPSKNGRVKWIASCAKRVEKRKKVPLLTLVGEYHLLTPLKNPPKQADLFTYLLDDDSKRAKDPLLKEQDLVYDSDLAIVAGSDTTSGSLAATTFLLAKHPEKFEKLRAEIDPLFTSANDFSHQAVTGKPMLEGCINEALRLFPPVPSGLQRMTPPEGVKIAGRYIPGDTLVSTPTYTIHRDPRNFVRPDEFIPERWSSEPDLIIRKDAFNPFSTGVFGCAGKPLAMMELRIVIALLVRKFDIKTIGMGRNYGARIFEDEPGMKDCFTAQMAPLNVMFEERK